MPRQLRVGTPGCTLRAAKRAVARRLARLYAATAGIPHGSRSVSASVGGYPSERELFATAVGAHAMVEHGSPTQPSRHGTCNSGLLGR
jgi:hypothetical protein